MRRGWGIILAVAIAAGCASKPEDDGLLASTAVVNELDAEEGDVVEVARFSQLSAGTERARGWDPYVLQAANPLTRYHVVERDGVRCMCADATNGHSALQRLIRIDPQRHPVIEWRWLVPTLEAKKGAPPPAAAEPNTAKPKETKT